jgi:DNA-binding HxlR family transcriptional regulator
MTQFSRSACPVAVTLDLIGDRWSLLVIRDLFRGRKRYGEFLASPERIPTNVLADRLRRLEEHGLIERRPYSQRPLRHDYLLTPKGRALAPVLRAICRWANTEIPGTVIPPDDLMRE